MHVLPTTNSTLGHVLQTLGITSTNRSTPFLNVIRDNTTTRMFGAGGRLDMSGSNASGSYRSLECLFSIKFIQSGRGIVIHSVSRTSVKEDTINDIHRIHVQRISLTAQRVFLLVAVIVDAKN